jgi:hypothetical protein
MAIAEQQTVEQKPEPKPTPRPAAFKWPTRSQIHRIAPIFRLLAEIWAIPEVKKVSILVDGAGANVLVVLPEMDREATSKVFLAERDFLNSTPLHSFDLHVLPTSRVPQSIQTEYELAGFETILER